MSNDAFQPMPDPFGSPDLREEPTPRRGDVFNAADHKYLGQIQLYLDGVRMRDKTTAFDVDAGTITCYVFDHCGDVVLDIVDNCVVPRTEVLRGSVEARWRHFG